MRILLAEDDQISRKMIQKMLESSGHEVIPAEDGIEAQKRIREQRPRILLTDWEMPGMDGISLCRSLRADKDADYVYVIIVTSRDSKSDAIKGLEAGADDYIAKPVDPEELVARIRTGERILRLEEENKKASAQLVHAEKMASVGQLAAGVAHEINNPTGFVSSNLKTLADYQTDLVKLLSLYRKVCRGIRSTGAESGIAGELRDPMAQIDDLEKEMDIDFVLEDIDELVADCIEGTDRIKKIVLDLKDFAHPGEDRIVEADINAGINSTLNVVWNELKYKAKVTKELGELPMIQCYPQQLNQVVLNLLINAAHAIEEKGEIHIRTSASNGHVEIRIRDTGVGIPEQNIAKIFDPFFTTKDVGKGTGLGLNVAYNIVQKHRGSIDVQSREGEGTEFRLTLPVCQEVDDSD